MYWYKVVSVSLMHSTKQKRSQTENDSGFAFKKKRQTAIAPPAPEKQSISSAQPVTKVNRRSSLGTRGKRTSTINGLASDTIIINVLTYV